MVSERLSWRVTCPNHASFRLLRVARRGSRGPTRKFILLRNRTLVLCSTSRLTDLQMSRINQSQKDTVDAEKKIPRLRMRNYQRVSILKPLIGQNKALPSSPSARSPAFLISTFPVHSTSLHNESDFKYVI